MRVIEKVDIAPVEPLLCSIQAGTAVIARSERFIIDAIARGKLKAVKSDRRTLLVVQSLKDHVASLPPAKGTKIERGSARHDPPPASPMHKLTGSLTDSLKISTFGGSRNKRSERLKSLPRSASLGDLGLSFSSAIFS